MIDIPCNVSSVASLFQAQFFTAVEDVACPWWAFLSCSNQNLSWFLFHLFQKYGRKFWACGASPWILVVELEYCSNWFYVCFGALNILCIGFCVPLVTGWLWWSRVFCSYLISRFFVCLFIVMVQLELINLKHWPLTQRRIGYRWSSWCR